MKKVEVPLYKQIIKKGRPVKYNYDEFLNSKTEFVVLYNCDESNYSSIRSTLTRWKKMNNHDGKFEYDFHPPKSKSPKCVVVWRSKTNGNV